MFVGYLKSKFGSRSSETVIYSARIFLAPGAALGFRAAAWDISTKGSFGSAWVIANHFHTTASATKNVLQKEFEMQNSRGVGFPIFQVPVKSCLCWSTKRDVANFTRIESKSFYWSRNAWWALISIFLSMLQNVFTIASRGHSTDVTGNPCS
jgi:hypothetical protein